MSKKSKSRPKQDKQESTSRPECKQYELDLTDYVMGDMTFLTKEKQEKLFEHLRKCALCREEFFAWENTYGVMVTKQHHAKPETQKRYAELMAKIKTEAGQRRPIDGKWQVGSAAGKIYELLKSAGEVSIPALKEKTGLEEYRMQQAIGWLIREEKIMMNEDNFAVYITLAEK